MSGNIFYFKFTIHTDRNGVAVKYSPDWCGERNRCARNEKALLYNDAELWGIGQAEGDYIPDDVIVLSEKEVLEIIADVYHITPNDITIDNAFVNLRVPVEDIENVYAGEKLKHRWDNKPQAYCKSLNIDFTGVSHRKLDTYSVKTDVTDANNRLPNILIKNLDNNYVKAFKDTGELLLSSISRYVAIGDLRQDAAEGINNIDIDITFPEPTIFNADDLGKYIAQFKFMGGEIEVAEKIVIKDKSYLPDAYVFCASAYRLEKFGDSYYSIKKAKQFGSILFNTLREQVDNQVYAWMVAPVIYGGIKDPIRTLAELKSLTNTDVNIARMMDCFYKPSEYSDEKEIRFVFFTKKQNIESQVYIRNLALLKCCKFQQ